MSVPSYIDLLSPHNRSLPRFSAITALILSQAEDLLEVLEDLPLSRRIDSASGVCLDLIGRLLDAGRVVELPASETPGASRIPFTLTDEQFRLLLRARVYSQHWDGTNEGVRACLDDLFGFAETRVLFSDHGDRTIRLTIPDTVTGVTRSMLLSGLLFPHPPAVTIRES